VPPEKKEKKVPPEKAKTPEKPVAPSPPVQRDILQEMLGTILSGKVRELVDSGKMDKSTAKTIEDRLLQQEITAQILAGFEDAQLASLGAHLQIPFLRWECFTKMITDSFKPVAKAILEVKQKTGCAFSTFMFSSRPRSKHSVWIFCFCL